MGNETTLTVEVAYALPHKQRILRIEVPAGTTAAEAARISRISEAFEGLDVEAAPLGIFGRRVPPEQRLRDGDRVEIYRPLIVDPKAARRARAARRGRESAE